jgi:hypothetical protein
MSSYCLKSLGVALKLAEAIIVSPYIVVLEGWRKRLSKKKISVGTG